MSQPPSPIDYATPYPQPRRRMWLWLIPLPALALLFLAMVALFMVRSTVRVTVTPATVAPAPPQPPTLPAVPQRIALLQRQQAMLAGTGSGVFVHIGDITGGQTLLTIRNAAGIAMLPTTSVQQGDIKTFPIAGNTFEIEVAELKNLL